jgi:hypothetical protein
VAEGVGVWVVVGVRVGRGVGVAVANTPGRENEQAREVSKKIKPMK